MNSRNKTEQGSLAQKISTMFSQVTTTQGDLANTLQQKIDEIPPNNKNALKILFGIWPSPEKLKYKELYELYKNDEKFVEIAKDIRTAASDMIEEEPKIFVHMHQYCCEHNIPMHIPTLEDQKDIDTLIAKLQIINKIDHNSGLSNYKESLLYSILNAGYSFDQQEDYLKLIKEIHRITGIFSGAALSFMPGWQHFVSECAKHNMFDTILPLIEENYKKSDTNHMLVTAVMAGSPEIDRDRVDQKQQIEEYMQNQINKERMTNVERELITAYILQNQYQEITDERNISEGKTETKINENKITSDIIEKAITNIKQDIQEKGIFNTCKEISTSLNRQEYNIVYKKVQSLTSNRQVSRDFARKP